MDATKRYTLYYRCRQTTYNVASTQHNKTYMVHPYYIIVAAMQQYHHERHYDRDNERDISDIMTGIMSDIMDSIMTGMVGG